MKIPYLDKSPGIPLKKRAPVLSVAHLGEMVAIGTTESTFHFVNNSKLIHVEGLPQIREYHIFKNKRYALTKDSMQNN